ncbi:MAG: hypothetical protein ABI641_10030 [Caldimonas sp.]
MSSIRISEFATRVPGAGAGGEWYAPETGGGVVRIERGLDLSRPLESSTTKEATTCWQGLRLCTFGSDRRGSLAYLLKYPVPLDYLDEFDAWFRVEHMPMLLEEPTWYGCEFYRSHGASCYPYAALHHLEPQALTSDARNCSVDTPWWYRLKRHAWFDKQFIRVRMKPL